VIGGPIAIDKTFAVLIKDGKIAGDNDEEALSTLGTRVVIPARRLDTTANDEARHSFARLGSQNMNG